jgi:malate dehydrogenase
MRRAKISIIGGGMVGSMCALWAARKELGDIVVLDIPDMENLVKGRMLDLVQCRSTERFDADIIGTADYADTANSDVVVITAGIPRKPGMSRDDLIETNVKIVKAVSEKVAEYSPVTKIIVVSNPLDAMVYTAWKASGFPTNRVMGQAGCLDVARFQTFVAQELNCSVEDIQGLMLGGHGDSMVPLPRYTAVHGVPINQLLSERTINLLVERARNGGGEIVKLMGTSAYYAPASGTIQMVEAIVKNKRRILPCAAYCEHEFGVGKPGEGYFVGVPCMIGKDGMEKVVEIDLDEAESKMFQTSVDHVKELVEKVRELFPELA